MPPVRKSATKPKKRCRASTSTKPKKVVKRKGEKSPGVSLQGSAPKPPTMTTRLTAKKKRERTDLAVKVFSEGLMRDAILNHLKHYGKALAIFGMLYNGYISRETARDEFLRHLNPPDKQLGCHTRHSLNEKVVKTIYSVLVRDGEKKVERQRRAIIQYLPALRYVPLVAMKAVKAVLAPKLRMKEIKDVLKKRGGKLSRVLKCNRAKYTTFPRRSEQVLEKIADSAIELEFFKDAPGSEYRRIIKEIEKVMEKNGDYCRRRYSAHIARHQLIHHLWKKAGRDLSGFPIHLQGACRMCNLPYIDWVEGPERKKKPLPGYYEYWYRSMGNDGDRRAANRREAYKDGYIDDFDDSDFDSDEYMYYWE